jgi:hypothetical protein
MRGGGRRAGGAAAPPTVGRALLIALLAAGCHAPVPVTHPDPAGPAPIRCCTVPGAPVELTYLGVGGWLIRRGGDALLTAPLFSNPGLFHTGLATIAPDDERIDGSLAALGVDLADVSLILSGHGHYDHLMDVPRVMERHAPRAVLLANRTAGHQIAAWGLADRVIAVDDRAGDQESAGEWIRRGDIRVMALRSHHGPHFAGITLYHGVRDRDMEERPRTALDWLDGPTFAYLVDFMEGDEVVFRLYYQDAVAAEPFGFVPDGLAPVDVAIVVPATYAEVSWQPEAVLGNVRPRHVLLGHWEDFFEPPLGEPEPVPFTRLGDFLRRMERVLPDSVGWHLPAPGARFEVR